MCGIISHLEEDEEMIEKKIDNSEQIVMSCEGCRDIVVIDSGYGKCTKISIEEGVDCTLEPRNPFTMSTCVLVEYENGKEEEATTVLKDVLTLGQVHCYTDDGKPGFLCNKQVVAALGKAIADLETFTKGEISVPSEEEANSIIAELDIPTPPLAYVEAEKSRPDVELEWSMKWRASGKLCYMSDLQDYEIEKTIPKDRKQYVNKSGEAVALESLVE